MGFDFQSSFGIGYALGTVLSLLIGLVCYIFTGIGLYVIAKRRGIAHAWLAWIPVVNIWIVGSISDQYRYITRGQIRNRRTLLLVGNIVVYVAITVLNVMMRSFLLRNMGLFFGGMDEAVWMEMLRTVLGYAAAALVLLTAFAVLWVFYLIALYDLYVSVNPAHSVAFLVLSIIFYFTAAFFIFFNRKKDLGMPPRCDYRAAPAVQPELQPPIQEPWENVTEE